MFLCNALAFLYTLRSLFRVTENVLDGQGEISGISGREESNGFLINDITNRREIGADDGATGREVLE